MSREFERLAFKQAGGLQAIPPSGLRAWAIAERWGGLEFFCYICGGDVGD